MRSHSAASSVAATRSARARDVRSSMIARGKALRRLRAPEPRAIHVRTIAPLSSTSLSVSTTGSAAHRAHALARLRDHALDRLVASTSGRAASCTSDDAHLVRQILEAIAHRIAALASADRDEQPVDVALKDPRRRIARVATSEARTRPSRRRRAPWNVCTLCSSIGLPATQRNCLSSVAARARCRFRRRR